MNASNLRIVLFSIVFSACYGRVYSLETFPHKAPTMISHRTVVRFRDKPQQEVPNSPIPEKKKKIFEDLKNQASNAQDTTQKCRIAEMALEAIFPVDSSLAAGYAEELLNAPWIEQGEAHQRGTLKTTMAISCLPAQKFVQAKAIFDKITPDELAFADIKATYYAYQVELYRLQGQVIKARTYLPYIHTAMNNKTLPAGVRLECAHIALEFDIMVGNVALRSTLKEAKLLLQTFQREKTAIQFPDKIEDLQLLVEGCDSLYFEEDATREIKATKDRDRSKDQEAIADRVADKRIKYRDRLAVQLKEMDAKYGSASRPVVRLILEIVSNDLFLPKQDPDVEALLMQEMLDLISVLERQPTVSLATPEDILLMKIAVFHRANRNEEALECYRKLAAAFDKFGLDENSGYRFASKLSVLPIFGDDAPDYVATEWHAGMVAFTAFIRGLALTDPNRALVALDTWKTNWTLFESIPLHHGQDSFMDGYIQATGIIKNVPYKKRALDADVKERLYGDIGLQDVQKRLSKECPMVVYVKFSELNGVEHYGAFLLDGSTTKYVRLGSAQEIEMAISAWSRSIPIPDGAMSKENPTQTGKKLYDLMLRPLFGQTLPHSLFIVPDAHIGDVSFAALRTPDSKWLVQECGVTYFGAVRDVVSGSRGQPSASIMLEATTYAQQDTLESPKLSWEKMKRIDPKAVEAPISRDTLMNARSPRFLHISAHGDFEERQYSDPLSFALASWLWVHSYHKDAKITAANIAMMKLGGTRCVMLASCDAGKSRILAGDGMGGLRRAFYIAGAEVVISSILPVFPAKDKEAPGDRLLSQLYVHLSHGESPARSLQQAQVDMLNGRGTASLYVWAGFICEGGK